VYGDFASTVRIIPIPKRRRRPINERSSSIVAVSARCCEWPPARMPTSCRQDTASYHRLQRAGFCFYCQRERPSRDGKRWSITRRRHSRSDWPATRPAALTKPRPGTPLLTPGFFRGVHTVVGRRRLVFFSKMDSPRTEHDLQANIDTRSDKARTLPREPAWHVMR